MDHANTVVGCLILIVCACFFFTVGMCSTARIVTRPSQEKKFPVGTDLTLRCQCRSSGTGMATTWMNNGITVTPEDGRIFLNRSKLIIYNASFADSGNYTCIVTVDKLGTAKSKKLDIWGTCVQEKLLKRNQLSRGALPSNGLLGICRWMGSHFHDSTDFNGVAFSSIFNRVTRMGLHFFGTLRVRKSFAQK